MAPLSFSCHHGTFYYPAVSPWKVSVSGSCLNLVWYIWLEADLAHIYESPFQLCLILIPSWRNILKALTWVRRIKVESIVETTLKQILHDKSNWLRPADKNKNKIFSVSFQNVFKPGKTTSLAMSNYFTIFDSLALRVNMEIRKTILPGSCFVNNKA